MTNRRWLQVLFNQFIKDREPDLDKDNSYLGLRTKNYLFYGIKKRLQEQVIAVPNKKLENFNLKQEKNPVHRFVEKRTGARGKGNVD